MKGIDISHYQGTINWEKLKDSGLGFAIQKCTQGTSYIDNTYKENKLGARSIGFVFGSYHFAGGGNAQREAKHFLDNIGDLNNGEILVLDYEANLKNPAPWCKEFLDAVYKETNIRPFFYTYEKKLLQFNWSIICEDYPLWIADYGTNDGTMQDEPRIRDWADWTIWQYTSKAKYEGIVGKVDGDFFRGTKEELQAYGKNGNQMPPEIEPEKYLIHPVKETESDPVYITQKFGENKAIYKRFNMEGHNGIDYRTRFWDSPLGHRYIVASKEGKVIEVGNEGNGGYGKYVRMEHDLDGSGNEQTIYGHLKKQYVSIGQIVKQGERIGLSDNTGFSTGPHLHFGYREKGWKKEYGNGFKGYSDPQKFIA